MCYGYYPKLTKFNVSTGETLAIQSARESNLNVNFALETQDNELVLISVGPSSLQGLTVTQLHGYIMMVNASDLSYVSNQTQLNSDIGS